MEREGWPELARRVPLWPCGSAGLASRPGSSWNPSGGLSWSVPAPRSTDEGHTSPVRGSDPRHDVHRPGCRGSPSAPAWLPARPPPPPPASLPPSPAPLSRGCCALGFLIWFSVPEAGVAVRINQQIGGGLTQGWKPASQWAVGEDRAFQPRRAQDGRAHAQALPLLLLRVRPLPSWLAKPTAQ